MNEITTDNGVLVVTQNGFADHKVVRVTGCLMCSTC